ncbi:MAG: hypothetical protein GX323_08915, partial [Clostridiales bacterium]|nr:hypothetical protein [Clostridiales bacterium]
MRDYIDKIIRSSSEDGREERKLDSFEGINFRLDTKHTTYMFRTSKYGHLEHVYYGDLLAKEDSHDVMATKHVIQIGSSIYYHKDDL